MFKEYDVVRLRKAMPEKGLSAEAEGTVLIVHQADPPAYEVEFCNKHGQTIALLTLREGDIEATSAT